MSAYVVSNETINAILAFMKADSGRSPHIYRSLENMDLVWTGKDAAWALGCMMLDLNIEAVCARYSDEKADVLKEGREFEHNGILPPSRIQAFKSLQCWLYQCTEGHIPEESDLFKAFSDVRNKMAVYIVNHLKEYDTATWG